MPEKTKTYKRVIFTPQLIKEADKAVQSRLPKTAVAYRVSLSVEVAENESWTFDDEEGFFAEYSKTPKYARFEKKYTLMKPPNTSGGIDVVIDGTTSRVHVSMPTRADLESVANIFDSDVERYQLPESPREEKRKKEKRYQRVVFTPEVIKEADSVVRKILKEVQAKPTNYLFSVEGVDGETWSHSNEEEFFADYRKPFGFAQYWKSYGKGSINFTINENRTLAGIEMPTRTDVEKVFDILESNVGKCRLPELPPEKQQKARIKVFIGHGRSVQWRDLKDHLHEKHGYDVEAYEIGARAGFTVQQVLEQMLTRSSLALLCLTGEDEDAGGSLHARENVIHELGLFQGRLGWQRAIALLEDGVQEFSNIEGVTQIRFTQGRIQETFGDVLATIKREFPDA